jgi:glycerol-3-phosphate dehydrogenase (NAD(P)+)
MNITVVGGGSWATALVKILSKKNVKIKWWLRDPQAVEHIKKHHHNPQYLSSVVIHPTKIKPYLHLKDALKNTEWVILAVPAAFIEEVFKDIPLAIFENKKFVSGIKGMIPSSNELVTDWLIRNLHISPTQIAAIAGPCHAEEIALEKQSYLTIASERKSLAEEFAQLLACRFVKTSSIVDLRGVEFAAVMKNIVALACGITHGLGAGDNFQAVMVANAMLEIERFVKILAPQGNRIINSSAYLGDLLVTAYSQFSRNRAFGNMLGRGYSIKTAQLEMKMIAEGYLATQCIYEINKKMGVEMPILDFTHKILYQKTDPKLAFENLKMQLF